MNDVLVALAVIAALSHCSEGRKFGFPPLSNSSYPKDSALEACRERRSGQEGSTENEVEAATNRTDRKLPAPRTEEIRMLERLQKIKYDKVAEAPRGVQDQFIEMLGNSKSPREAPPPTHADGLFFCFQVIPQTCWYKGVKFDCGLSISCVLAGGKPLDLCSGGMIWSCCVSAEKIPTKDPAFGTLHNASKYEPEIKLIVGEWMKVKVKVNPERTPYSPEFVRMERVKRVHSISFLYITLMVAPLMLAHFVTL